MPIQVHVRSSVTDASHALAAYIRLQDRLSREALLLQHMNGMRVALREKGGEDVSAAKRAPSFALSENRGALHHALKCWARCGRRRRAIRKPLVDMLQKLVAQPTEIDLTREQCPRSVGIIQQGEEEMLNARLFLSPHLREPDRTVKDRLKLRGHHCGNPHSSGPGSGQGSFAASAYHCRIAGVARTAST